MRKNDIIPLLKKAYAAELETVQNYLANSVWLDGLRAREVAEALAAEIPEELGHAQKLAHRLKQLGGAWKREHCQVKTPDWFPKSNPHTGHAHENVISIPEESCE